MSVSIHPRGSDGHGDASARQIVQLWRPLAQRGHSRAQYIMGRLYLAGKGAPRDFRKARIWFGKAAEQHNPDAQLCLGLMYLRGQGMTRNPTQAARWIRLAAEQGVVRAQCYLSRMYALGLGMPKSYVYAYMWAMLAATGGRRSLTTARIGNEKLRAYALNTLEGFARRMSRDEANAAVRMAKKWRARFQGLTLP